MYRKYINIVEAANKGCPIATYDLEVNVKNRQTAIDKHHYGPANPDEPGSYWKDSAKQWSIDEKTAKTYPFYKAVKLPMTITPEDVKGILVETKVLNESWRQLYT